MVSKVRDFTEMFYNAKNFDKDLSTWNALSAEKVNGMFIGAAGQTLRGEFVPSGTHILDVGQ